MQTATNSMLIFKLIIPCSTSAMYLASKDPYLQYGMYINAKIASFVFN
jgi:hypothetical protein